MIFVRRFDPPKKTHTIHSNRFILAKKKKEKFKFFYVQEEKKTRNFELTRKNREPSA